MNSRFIAKKGALKDLEDKILKVDKRDRVALLQCVLFSKNDF